MKDKTKLTLWAIGLSILYAIFLRLLFGIDNWSDLYSVMTITFLVLMPTIMGSILVYFSDLEMVKKRSYRIFMPWLAVFGFFLITLVFSLEGILCWLMVLPIFFVMGSIGGLIGGYYRLKKDASKLQLSLLVLLPLMLAPVEQFIGAIPGQYEAYTFIDIEASAEEIWSEVTRVSEISPAEDKGFLNRVLDFPRPLRAELDYEGIGASREAIFSKGLIFHEVVTEYEHQKKMVFTIDADPQEIPSTTLDEHIVVGGEFFDVLTGTYELEELSANRHRLHLYSRFELNTTFNFYASWWAKFIMRDIQNNILQVEKRRAEQK